MQYSQALAVENENHLLVLASTAHVRVWLAVCPQNNSTARTGGLFLPTLPQPQFLRKLSARACVRNTTLIQPLTTMAGQERNKDNLPAVYFLRN